ncbi:low molecular weight protein-tyrosine-phosphatase [Maricaulis sp.]|uniref:low molecular weight protein-tyrosine-phosphatase n=1 Tax=unclassified Maricaulis TaxID=2632371 RepID=UPI001AFDC32A|nr:low molecular weight protein-tyrosine-phosphatase [Maricaulis sp.]MBO6795814.1 low molecular weight phosphotyrosine protein phosphatase [Maricaulis sp.]
MTRILFLCTGNICRSPLADGYARYRVQALGLDWHIDSAGTGAWHVGEAPDPRARAVAYRRGYPIDSLRARQLDAADHFEFDYIIALDRSHLDHLQRYRPQDGVAENTLLLSWSNLAHEDVADPYYDDDAAFELTADEIEAGVDALIAALQTRAS